MSRAWWWSCANAPFIAQEKAVADNGMTGYWCWHTREQGWWCSEGWCCRHTHNEMAKPAGAAKQGGAAVWNGAESYRAAVRGHFMGPGCCVRTRAQLMHVAYSAKWGHHEGYPSVSCSYVATSRRRFVRRMAQRPFHWTKACPYNVLATVANRQRHVHSWIDYNLWWFTKKEPLDLEFLWEK